MRLRKYLHANARAIDPESAGKASEKALMNPTLELMSAQWNDNRARAMFESIVSDCNRIGDLGDFE
jgi:hypothetical protein